MAQVRIPLRWWGGSHLGKRDRNGSLFPLPVVNDRRADHYPNGVLRLEAALTNHFYSPRNILRYESKKVKRASFGSVIVMSDEVSESGKAAILFCEKNSFEHRIDMHIDEMLINITHAEDAIWLKLSV